MKATKLTLILAAASVLSLSSCEDTVSSSVEEIRTAQSELLLAKAAKEKAIAALTNAEASSESIQNAYDSLNNKIKLQAEQINLQSKQIDLQIEEIALESNQINLKNKQIALETSQLSLDEKKKEVEATFELWLAGQQKLIETKKQELEATKALVDETKNDNTSDAYNAYSRGLSDLASLRNDHANKLRSSLSALDLYNNTKDAYNKASEVGDKAFADTTNGKNLQESLNNANTALNDVKAKIEKKEAEVNVLKGQLDALLSA